HLSRHHPPGAEVSPHAGPGARRVLVTGASTPRFFSRPGTPVYVWHYLGERPQEITEEEA
ncbi:hypothetical protein, partial [Streptomyces avermitilis]|uniref:hypothetical protein n=1 Tax=Streptomyces avermitilis TaxID=33903 RepID=UPI0033EA54E8